ncbi:MAG: transposase [Anaerolineae bacterium]|nr:transposase [Anaerolineae bacterium]
MSYQFLPGKRFRWHKTNYQIKEVISDGQEIRIKDLFTGEQKNFPVSELVAAFFRNEIQFEIEGRQAKPVADGELSTEYQYLNLEDCPEHLVKIAKWRLSVIEPLLDMAGNKRTRETVERRVNEIKSTQSEDEKQYRVSVTSVYHWIRDYTQANYNLRALIPTVKGRCGRPGQSRLAERVNQIIEEKIEEVYLKRRVKTTVQQVHEAIAHQIQEENKLLAEGEKMEAPGYSTIARRVAALDPKEVYILKHGHDAAWKRFKQYGAMDYPELPLEKVEIDHTPLDLIVLDFDAIPLGRLTFTHCIDTATRFPLGYYLGFEPPNYLTVMECLKHAIMPKHAKEQYETKHEWLAYGIPVSLAIDNGKEFRGHGLEDACQLLGIILEPCKVRSPWQKPAVERSFRTVSEGVIHTLPGTTFSNIMQKGDYKSVKEACIFLDDIDKIINIYLIDYYAQKYQRGLGGVPARQWEVMTQNGFFPRLPANIDELTILLCPFTERVIWHYGIDFESLRYNSPDLVYLRTKLKEGEKVKIKYNPGDLSHIYVYNPLDEQYITIPSLAGEYTQNLSLWKHKVIKQVARQNQDKVDLAELWRARQRIQEIVQAGLERKGKIHRKIARYKLAGKPTRELLSPKATGVEIVETEVVEQESVKQLPPPENIPLFSLNQKRAEGWEIVKGGLLTHDDNRKEEEE